MRFLAFRNETQQSYLSLFLIPSNIATHVPTINPLASRCVAQACPRPSGAAAATTHGLSSRADNPQHTVANWKWLGYDPVTLL